MLQLFSELSHPANLAIFAVIMLHEIVLLASSARREIPADAWDRIQGLFAALVRPEKQGGVA